MILYPLLYLRNFNMYFLKVCSLCFRCCWLQIIGHLLVKSILNLYKVLSKKKIFTFRLHVLKIIISICPKWLLVGGRWLSDAVVRDELWQGRGGGARGPSGGGGGLAHRTRLLLVAGAAGRGARARRRSTPVLPRQPGQVLPEAAPTQWIS